MHPNSLRSSSFRMSRAGAWLRMLAFAAAGLSPLLAQPADPAADLYFSANGLYNRGLYSLASDQYKEFAAKFPNHEKAVSARLGLALSLYGAG